MASKLGGVAFLVLWLGMAGCDRILPFTVASPPLPPVDLSPALSDVGVLPDLRVLPDRGELGACCAFCRPYEEQHQILWPVAPEGVEPGPCTMANDTVCPAVEDCAANFLNFGGCGLTKEYVVPPIPGRRLMIAACSDGCAPARPVLKYPSYQVEEITGGSSTLKTVSYEGTSCAEPCREEELQVSVPESESRIRIRALPDPSTGEIGFYLCVFIE